jgi:hypothetical protein
MEFAGDMSWWVSGKNSRRWLQQQRKPIRGSKLGAEELEIRLVPTMLGQQLFPADYPWNQNISNAPVAANSAAVIANIGSSIGIHPDWGNDSASNGSSPLYGIPYNVVHGNSTAKINVIIDNYPGESDILPVPMPANPVIEGDFQNGPNHNVASRGDSHLIVWDEDNNIAYEFFQASRPSENADGKWHAAQESVWQMGTDSFRPLGYTSADAAGLSILAGLARPDEGLPTTQGGQGAINHALRFTLPSGDLLPQYIYPASHVVSGSLSSVKLPFGARLRLKNTAAVNLIINSLGPEAQIVAHAMQQYGLVLADIGSAMYVTGSSSAQDANNNISQTWDMNDVLGLHSLTANDFDVVNLTPVVTGLSSTTGSAGSTITINGQNFSGSAGHLSVFFGNTAATSVSFVDDSHITAVIPSGSGTVDVTVQSGVNATDPNNPSDNVNAPIFGYGTSATTAADQFTFSNQTVGSTNSTDSFASSNVVSGNTDLLTIVVKDTTGAAISGLPNGAFSFSLAGGTSAGTFSAVTQTATAGTYTATFTGITAGTASTLTVTVNSVALSTKPTVTVTVGSVSGSTSTVGFVSPSVASGSTDLLTIAVKDAAGNAITGLAISAFGFSLASGASAGTFGTVTETSTKGPYTANFTGTTAGTASTLTTTVNGVKLTGKPTVQVAAGPASSVNSSVSFASPSVAVGNSDLVTIVVKDAAGNAVTGLANSAFAFTLSNGTSAGSFGMVTETTTKGTYTASFNAITAGTASTLTATVSGISLSTKPTVQVIPGGVTLPFSDSFTTSNGGQIDNQWTVQLGSVAAGNNQAVGTGAFNLATVNGISQADVQAHATVNLSAGQSIGVVTRYGGPGYSNFYMGQLRNTGSGLQGAIFLNMGGSFTALSVGPTFSASAGTLEFETVGSSLKLIYNGQLIASAFDTMLTAGSIGMRMNQGVTVSNFTADKVVATSPALPFSDNFAATSDGSQLSRNWSDQLGNVTVTGNQAVGTGGTNLSTLNGISQADVKVTAGVNVGMGQTIGLVARYGGPLYSNFYLGQLRDTGSGFQAAIFKNIGGNFYTVAVGSTIPTANGTLEFEVVGNSLKLILGGKLVAFGFDNSLTGGSVGMRLSTGAAVTSLGADKVTATNGSLPFSDNFTSPSDGSQLTHTWSDQLGDFTINGSTQAVGIDSTNLSTVNGINVADVTVQGDINLVPGSGQTVGLVARYSGPGYNNFYLAQLRDTGSGFQAAIFKNIGGSFTLVSLGMVSSTGAGTLKFKLHGTSLELDLGNTILATGMDSSLTTGSVGMRLSTGANLANFGAA